MIPAEVVVLVVAAMLALIAPPLGRRLPPALATRVLVGVGVAVAAVTGFVCCVAVFTLVGQLPLVARLGPWSAQVVHDTRPVPIIAALAGGLLAVPTASHAVPVLLRRLATFARVEPACGGCRIGNGGGERVVVDSDRPDAFATPGRARIVSPPALMRALPVSALGGRVPDRVQAFLEPRPPRRLRYRGVPAVCGYYIIRRSGGSM